MSSSQYSVAGTSMSSLSASGVSSSTTSCRSGCHCSMMAIDMIVRLNVGGVKYMTTKDTLLSRGENFFSSLLNGSIPAIRDEKGYLFIDRNGRYFEFILEFLRSGHVDIPVGVTVESIFREADFYLIQGFHMQWLNQQLKQSSRKGSSNELATKKSTKKNTTIRVASTMVAWWCS
eukprot:gene4353-5083_t